MASSGERQGSLIHSLDYDCVERFRLRRLLAFLRLHRYDGAFQALSEETGVLFRAEYLQHLVRRGRCSDAVKYLYRFVPLALLPPGAKLLVKFIRFVSRILHEEGAHRYDPYNPVQIYFYGGPTPGGIKLAKIISTVQPEEVRASINWPLVRLKAAEIVGHWVALIPELNDMRRLPRCSAKPANVLPIGLSSRGCRGGLKKKSLGQNQMPADAIARSFLSKKRMSFACKGTRNSGLQFELVTMTQIAELIEECLKAGGMVVNAEMPTESSCSEGTKMTLGPLVHNDVVPGESERSPGIAEHNAKSLQESDRRKVDCESFGLLDRLFFRLRKGCAVFSRICWVWWSSNSRSHFQLGKSTEERCKSVGSSVIAQQGLDFAMDRLDGKKKKSGDIKTPVLVKKKQLRDELMLVREEVAAMYTQSPLVVVNSELRSDDC